MKQNDNDLINPLLYELKKIGTAAELIKKAETVATNAAHTIEELEHKNLEFVEIIEEQKRLLDKTASNLPEEPNIRAEIDLIELTISELVDKVSHIENESATKLMSLETELSNNLETINYFSKIIDELKVKINNLMGIELIVKNLRNDSTKIAEKTLSEISHFQNVMGSIRENNDQCRSLLKDLTFKVNGILKDYNFQKLSDKLFDNDIRLSTIKKTINMLTEENEQLRAKFDRINIRNEQLINNLKSEYIREINKKDSVIAKYESRLNKTNIIVGFNLAISAIVIGYFIVRELL